MTKERVYKAKNPDDFWRIVEREQSRWAAWRKKHPKAKPMKLIVELPI